MLATIIPCTFWLVAAYLSHITPTSESLSIAVTALGVAGLCAPAVIALSMIETNTDLRYDLNRRFFGFKRSRPFYLFLTCFLMLASILLAQAISLLFGYSADQFRLVEKSSFAGGVLPGWFWIFFAPLVEELAWHTYGTDCLRQRMNLLYTCLLFTVFWAIWHYPLFFIKGYYHSNVAETGLLYSLNFMASIFPFVILMNWLYYKTHRSTLVAFSISSESIFFNKRSRRRSGVKGCSPS